MSKWEKHATYLKKGLVNIAPYLMIPNACLHGYCPGDIADLRWSMSWLLLTLEYVLVTKRGKGVCGRGG